jgi:apolipoprotein D and lipocalin family protein
MSLLKFPVKFVVSLGLGLLMAGSVASTQAADLKTTQTQPVSSVDLTRYMGTWYEVGSIPMFFQRMCIQNTQAQYTLLDNGAVKVINQCQKKDGSLAKAEGRAKVVNTTQNSRLKVSFLAYPFQLLARGDYWIIDLASDYRYAVVGHPSRKYGWILSRDRILRSEDLMTVRDNLKKQGYDPCRFHMTPQQEPSPETSHVSFSIPNPPTRLCDLPLP